MTKDKKRFLVIVAVLFAALTLIAFAVPFVRNGTFWVAYIFAVIAIAAQVYAFPVAFEGKSAKSKFYGFPIARLTVIYLAVQFALSIVSMATAKWVPAWVGILLFSLILCAAAIGFIAADAMRNEVERQDTALKKDVTVMRSLQSKLRMMESNCEGEAKKAVSELSELARYSDPVSHEATAAIEAELMTNVDELQAALVDGENEAILAMCKKCTALLGERNSLCRLNK